MTRLKRIISIVTFITLLIANIIQPYSIVYAKDSSEKQIVQQQAQKFVLQPNNNSLHENTDTKSEKDKREIIIKYNDESKAENLKKDVKNKLPGLRLDSVKKLANSKLEVLDIGVNGDINKVLTELKNNSNVQYVHPNYKLYTSQVNPQDSRFGEQWGLQNIGQYVSGQAGTAGIDVNATKAWEITEGDPSVIVGVLDTGIDINHKDLRNNIFRNPSEISGNGIDDDRNGYIDDSNGWDFYNNDNTVYDSPTSDTHGTHVAGIIAADDNTEGIRGIAPNVRILPLKFINGNYGYTSDAIEAIEYAKSLGVKIINCSWGGTELNYALKDAIQTSGILFICAAGNNGQDVSITPIYPAAFDLPNTISVSAIDNKGNLASYSNYGNNIDFAAPGTNILSTFPGDSYKLLSGTSMAAPLATGAAALVLSKNPGLSSESMKSKLIQNTTKLAQLSGKVDTGGILNAFGALNDNGGSLYNNTKEDISINQGGTTIKSRSDLELPFTFESEIDYKKNIVTKFRLLEGAYPFQSINLYIGEKGKKSSVYSGDISASIGEKVINNLFPGKEYSFSVRIERETSSDLYVGQLTIEMKKDKKTDIPFRTYARMQNISKIPYSQPMSVAKAVYESALAQKAVTVVGSVYGSVYTETKKTSSFRIGTLSVVWEVESNNSMGLADRFYDGDDIYGSIGDFEDIDFYKVMFPNSGKANFYLDRIPEGQDYDLFVYNQYGVKLWSSEKGGNEFELINLEPVEAGVWYYVKIIGYNGSYDNSYYYHLKVRNYLPPTVTLNSPEDGAIYNLGDTINVLATGTNCHHMAVFINDVCQDDSYKPGNYLNYNFTPTSAGNYKIDVRGRNTESEGDDGSILTTSDAIFVTVGVDITPPTAVSITSSGSPTNGTSFKVYANGVIDPSGIDKVVFPTWTVFNGQDDLKADWPNNCIGTYDSANDRWEYTVNISEHNNETGEYNIHVYAWDNAGNYKVLGYANVVVDVTPPPAVLITTSGSPTNGSSFKIYANSVRDSQSGIAKVVFPTWTTVNGQDDLKGDWPSNCIGTYDTANDRWEYTVNISEHNNETGEYNIHVYAWDNAGNFGVIGTTVVVVTQSVSSQGWLDWVNGYGIEGWAWNPSRPDDTVEVNIYIDGQLKTTVQAGNYREDLALAGIGNGNHGFLYQVDWSGYTSGTHKVEVYVVDGSGVNLQLPGSPKSFTFTKSQGYVDWVNEYGIEGWAWDTSRPNDPIEVHIYIDGQLKTTVQAGKYRSDLASAGIGNGYHGFLYQIDWSSYSPGTHTVEAYAVDGSGINPQLQGSPKTFTVTDVTPPTAGPITTSGSPTYGTSFKVYANGVRDSQSGIDRVFFPTWTTANGQDDLEADWTSNYLGTYDSVNDRWEYTVNISEHNNEAGEYITHVYAWDNAGNSVMLGGAQVTVIQGAVNHAPLTWITNSGQITLRFGQVDEQYSAVHTGVDVQGSLGDDIRSAVNGQVVYTGYDTYYGNVVYINAICDGKNIQTRYAHLQSNTINVSVGQQVTAGYVIGKMGNTGGTTGGYLVELELLESTDGNSCRVDGTNTRKVDPLPYFETIFSNDEYLSEQFAVSINHQSVGTQGMSTLAIWPWEDENDPDVRYRENLDLDEEKGEVYLRKQVEKYAWEIARIKKENLGSSNVLVYNSSNNTVTVNLNSRSKTFAYNSYSVKNKNNRMVVRAEAFYSYFFIYPTSYDYNQKGSLILLSHGLGSNVGEFEKTVLNLDDDVFISGGTIVANTSDRTGIVTLDSNFNVRVQSLGIDTNLSIREKIQQLINRGKYVMFRTEYSNNQASHADQIQELKYFIDKLNPVNEKVVLVGHSKGGLVSLGVAGDATYKSYVKQVITVNTPYLNNTLAEIRVLAGHLPFVDEGSPAVQDLCGNTTARVNIRDNWNSNGDAAAYAIAVSMTYAAPGMGDGVVSLDSQKGGDFSKINQRIFKPYKHYGVLYWEDDYFHTVCPDRYEISREIKRILLSVETGFKQ